MSGAGTAGGMGFQHRTAAWIATRILAETNAAPPWGLAAAVSLDSLRCEQDQPIDDILVGNSAEGYSFIQAKRSLDLSAAADSEFASVIDQFARQFIASLDGPVAGRAWSRPPDQIRDRFVLVVGPTASGPIRIHLPAVLERLRGLTTAQEIADAATNEGERAALEAMIAHAERKWRAAKGVDISRGELRELLNLVRVQTLDVEAGGAAELEAKTILRTGVLRNPNDGDAAWTSLVSLCQDLATTKSGRGRPQFQRHLLDAGIDVQAVRSFQDDIARLRVHSVRTCELISDLAHISIGASEIKIIRPAQAELRRLADEDSLLVVGEPGAGKSGSLHELSRALLDEGNDIVFLAVDKLSAQSLGALRLELGLKSELPTILENWPGIRPAYLVIDALDAARGSPGAQTFQDLIRLARKAGGRWRVVASIRKFDLRYSENLQKNFAGDSSVDFQDPEFSEVRHVNIPTLSDEELSQAKAQAPSFGPLIDNAPIELLNLLRVPFNLRLAAELLDAGIGAAELTPIRTQLGLLEKYWRARVIREDGLGDAREAILRRLCQEMVSTRLLRAERFRVVEPATAQALDSLLSRQVVVEWQVAPGSPADRDLLAFPHNVLFDYAVARLYFPQEQGDLVARLSAEPDLVLVVRPSLTMLFHRLWITDRTRFWALMLGLIAAPALPEVGKLIAPTVLADLTSSAADLEPLYGALESTDLQVRERAEQILRHVIGALLPGAS